MKNEFEPLSKIAELLLSKEELIDYYRDLRQYLCYNQEKIPGVKFRQFIHPVLRKALTARRLLAGQSIKVLNQRETKTDIPTIYAISHIGKFDLEIVSEVIDDSFYIFAGDPECMYRTFDGYFMELNGVIYVDTESKSDRKVAKDSAVKLLKQGGNLVIYPEGVWNLTANQVILPLYSGVIDIARETDAIIVPISLEQYGKDFIVNYGAGFDVNRFFATEKDPKIARQEATSALRDEMATLKWDIWQTMPLTLRDEIPDDYYEQFVDEKINEWPFYTKELVDSRVYKPKGIVTTEEAFQHLKTLKPNRNNAFLFRNK